MQLLHCATIVSAHLHLCAFSFSFSLSLSFSVSLSFSLSLSLSWKMMHNLCNVQFAKFSTAQFHTNGKILLHFFRHFKTRLVKRAGKALRCSSHCCFSSSVNCSNIQSAAFTQHRKTKNLQKGDLWINQNYQAQQICPKLL